MNPGFSYLHWASSAIAQHLGRQVLEFRQVLLMLGLAMEISPLQIGMNLQDGPP
jgi:hypothetical protein